MSGVKCVFGLLHVVSYVSQWQSLQAISAAEVPHYSSSILSGGLSHPLSQTSFHPSQYSNSKSIDQCQIHLLTASSLYTCECWCFGERVHLWGHLSLMPASVTLLILIQPGRAGPLRFFFCLSLVSIAKSKKQERGVAGLGF